MRINKKNQNFPKGTAIAYSLIMIAVISIILFSMIQFVISQVKYSYYVESRAKAFQIAEAGVYFYRWYLAHQTDGKTTMQVQDFWQNGDPLCVGEGNECEYTYEDPSGGNVGVYRISVTMPDPNSSTVTIVSEGWTFAHPEITRTIKARLRRPAWSDYAVLTNDFSHFDATWTIKGKVMSNTGVHYDGVAYNVVSAGLSTYFDSETGVEEPGVWTSWPDEFNTSQNSDVFLAGKRFPVVQKDFTGATIDTGIMKTEAQKPDGNTINDCSINIPYSNGCYFDIDSGVGRHIKLKTDGTFDISTVTSIKNNSNSIKKESSFSTFTIPNNGLIFVNGSVWIEGSINNSRVTIVSATIPASGDYANIYVGMNNLTYTNFDAKDVIGLISQGDIEYTEDGPSDLVIDAALLAQNGGLIKKDYNPNCCGIGCEENKNTIGIFGSVASNKTLAFLVAKVCDNEKAVGFMGKQISYDNNLLYFPPPFFPSDSLYSIDLWEEL